MQDSFHSFQFLMDFVQAEWFKLPLEDLNAKPNPSKWSKKEILGHLIDSAINNTTRLIVGQFEILTIHPYNQDKWVTTQNYQEYDEDELFKNWHAINYHFLNVAKNIKEPMWEKECQLPNGDIVTLRWLYYDYIAHMKHHLKQIFGYHPDL